VHIAWCSLRLDERTDGWRKRCGTRTTKSADRNDESTSGHEWQPISTREAMAWNMDIFTLRRWRGVIGVTVWLVYTIGVSSDSSYRPSA
jgi:hypothetical protein